MKKKFFSQSVMNGATLFGIAITLFALAFGISENLSVNQLLILFGLAYLYLGASFFAFIFPSLSE